MLFASIRLPTKLTSHLEQFLLFSRQARLHVRLMPPPSNRRSDNSEDNWKQILPYLPRTESLTLYVQPPSLVWPVCSVLTTLECIVAEPANPRWFSNIGLLMPALQTLITTVEILGLDWLSSNLPPTLRHLDLAHNTLQPIGTMDELLGKCNDLPQLETLAFSVLQRNNYPTSDSSIQLELRRMKRISLSGSSTPILTFLHHASVIERLDLSITNDGGPHITSLSHILNAKLSPVQFTSTVKPTYSAQVLIRASKPDIVSSRLSLWRSDTMHENNTSPLYDVQLEFPNNSLSHIRALAENLGSGLTSRLSLVTSCRIALEGGCDFPDTEIVIIRNLFRHLLQVSHLEVDLGYPPSPEHTRGFVLQFPIVLDPERNGSEPVLLPLLRTWHVNVREGTYPFSRKSIWNSFRIFFTHLSSTLRNRKEAGLKVESLQFNASKVRHNQWYHNENPQEELTTPLRELVEKVEVIPPPIPYQRSFH